MLYFLGSCLFICVLFYFVSQLFRKLKGTEEETMLDNNAPKRLKHVEEETMSDKNAPQIKYDVFVSFRGGDIRRGFLSHLSDIFERNNINAFLDYNLEKGDEIWPSLVKAIEESSISLIIFSPDYISSRWCLEELVTILECKQKYGRIVIPVFYQVQPTEVGHQSSESYKNAFADHQAKHESKVQIWRDALKTSAKISGIVSSMFRDDDKLLKEIVKLVLTRLGKELHNGKGLVGTDKRIQDLESLICKEPESTRLIGIWGMGGIGKTTLAEEVFNKLQNKFQGSCFLANERERSSGARGKLISLKEEIFAKLLGHDVKIDTPNSLPNSDRVRRMKVLIVLDDVNDSSHFEELLGSLDGFGSGSRIMITTRDKQVLNANKVDDVYQLGELNFDEALKLFKLNAFNNGDHQSEYDELSERMVNYAKGIPLVLKVLARLLRGKNKEVWKSQLEKLNKVPLPKVYDIMKLSYDDLDRKEQQIFLDLACFFLRSHEKVKISRLELLLRDDENDRSIVVGLEMLKDKALITFSEDEFVSIHDSLQEMACEIVRRESPEDPGKRSRLWDFDDIDQILKNDKGTELIRSILLHFPAHKKIKLRHFIFANMSKLRFLEVYHAKYEGTNNEQKSETNEHQKAGTVGVLKILTTDELRFLNLTGYPLNSFPEKFSGKKLVILKLQYGKMKKLWNGVKNLENLKQLDLHLSDLKKLPDLSNARDLEVYHVFGCNSLRTLPKLPPSLVTLQVTYCNSLQTLPELPSSLVTLSVSVCNSLRTLPELPSSLVTLSVSACNSLRTLPELPSSLVTVSVTYWDSLRTLPELPSSLVTLYVSVCYSLRTLPELPSSLVTLYVSICYSLRTLPELPSSLVTLDVTECNSLQTLPELPSSLVTLDVTDCDSLRTLPELPSSLVTLYVSVCNSLRTLPELPSSLVTLYVSVCDSLRTLPELPSSLVTLQVTLCYSLRTLPELPSSLVTLAVKFCNSLQTLPELPSSLVTLDVTDCNSLRTLPEL